MSTFSDVALLAEDAEDARVNADPAISAADLEEAGGNGAAFQTREGGLEDCA